MRSVPQIDSFSIGFTLPLCFLLLVVSQYIFYIDFFLVALHAFKMPIKRLQQSLYFFSSIKSYLKSFNSSSFQSKVAESFFISTKW